MYPNTKKIYDEIKEVLKMNEDYKGIKWGISNDDKEMFKRLAFQYGMAAANVMEELVWKAILEKDKIHRENGDNKNENDVGSYGS
jgi:hypothetical protein